LKPHRTNADAVHAAIPVNLLRASKTRLAPFLNAENRRNLSAAMLVDVLRALRKVREIHRITVVSADRSVRRIAKEMGVNFLWEGKRRDLNKAVRLAIRDALRRGATASLILPSDIPLVTAHEIAHFLKLSGNYSITISPSMDGYGTNALLLRPPGAIKPAFGQNSFRAHLTSAHRKHLSTKVVNLNGIAFDVDNPSDLPLLMHATTRIASKRILSDIDL